MAMRKPMISILMNSIPISKRYVDFAGGSTHPFGRIMLSAREKPAKRVSQGFILRFEGSNLFE